MYGDVPVNLSVRLTMTSNLPIYLLGPYYCITAALPAIYRDTMSFATKLCHVVYADGSAHDVMKHPATDKGKISLPGTAGGHRVAGGTALQPHHHHMGGFCTCTVHMLIQAAALRVLWQCTGCDVLHA